MIFSPRRSDANLIKNPRPGIINRSWNFPTERIPSGREIFIDRRRRGDDFLVLLLEMRCVEPRKGVRESVRRVKKNLIYLTPLPGINPPRGRCCPTFSSAQRGITDPTRIGQTKNGTGPNRDPRAGDMPGEMNNRRKVDY